jgi:putative beta-lysine N-acetyltransferase
LFIEEISLNISRMRDDCMPEDTIEHIQGSLIQHGHHNDRIYLMRLNTDPPETLIPVLDEMARENTYGKICAKIPAPFWRSFQKAGYEKEAVVPGFFSGRFDAFFIAKYVSPARKFSREDAKSPVWFHQTAGITAGKFSRASHPPSEIELCQPEDAEDMSAIYRQVFPSYPFPIQRPAFIKRMIKTGHRYFCVRLDERVAALAAAEIDLSHKVAEMTDFATIPEWRGRGLAGRLLQHMHGQVRKAGIRTTYTIARAASRGMNSVFSNCGYRYAGLLRNNSQICGSIQSMTVWYQRLSFP